MDDNIPELLTVADFFRPAGWLPPDAFSCPECGVDTEFIHRHTKYKYIAEFRCHNPRCCRLISQKWYRCRVCTHYKNKHFADASTHLLTGIQHNQCLTAFESSMTREYAAHENSFTNETTTWETRPSIDDETVINLGDIYDGLNLSQDSESSSNNQDQSIPAPTTVNEWKCQFIENSPPLPLVSGDLSSYFPNEEEETPIRNYIRRPLNAPYYECNLVQPGGGPRLLTAKAVVGISIPAVVNMVSPKDALWCTLLAKISDELSLSNQRILVALLDHATRPAKSKGLLPLPIPKTHSELRRNFISGRSSIPELLPRPTPIRILDNGFVYVSIRDILQYHLANNGSLDPLIHLKYYGRSSLPALHGSSPRGRELLSFSIEGTNASSTELTQGTQGPLPLTKFPTEVIIWSDGFDPNANKNNRGSAHVIFISIGTPQDDYHSGCNTYPISIGPADGDISIVARMVSEELAELFKSHSSSNTYFESASKKEIFVFLLVFCLLQDRPERCAWLCLAYGNGKYGGRFGWAGDLSQTLSLAFLPSCEKCNSQRMNNQIEGSANVCTRCADWSMSNLLFEAPKDYPRVFMDRNNQSDDMPSSAPSDTRVSGKYLECHQISVDKLKLASIAAFDMVRQEKWTKKEGKAYLETHGLSPKFCKDHCDAAGRKENMPKLPATWNIPGVDICNHIDVPMHLCFLGVTKAMSTDLISGWLKSKKKSTSFLERSAPLLAKVRQLSLSWCKAETKFGGFVSENWVAYCRTFKYIHQILAKDLENNDKQYEDPPGLALSAYKFKQKKAWLLARQIEGITSSSRKKEVDEMFAKYLSLEVGGVLPPIVKPIVSEATLEDVNHMVICWHVCMSRVMSLDQNPMESQVADIERHIKLFLSAVEVFDLTRRTTLEKQQLRKMNKDRSSGKRVKVEPKVVIPIWRQKTNFVGLLNYPEAMRHMGPIRVLTELDFKGEASIKRVKSKIKQGMKGNWAYNAMLGYYRERSFQYVLKDCLRGIDGDESQDETMIRLATQLVRTSVEEPSEEDSETEDANSDDDTTTEDDGDSSDEDDEEQEDQCEDDNGRTSKNTRYKEYQKFETKEDALDSLDGENPVSGMVVNGRFYVVIKNTPTPSLLEIKPRKWIKRVCGADYFVWEPANWLGGEGLDAAGIQRMVTDSRESFLLLPYIRDCKTVDDGYSFYLISSDWREVTTSGEGDYSMSDDDECRFALQLPRIPEAKY